MHYLVSQILIHQLFDQHNNYVILEHNYFIMHSYLI